MFDNQIWNTDEIDEHLKQFNLQLKAHPINPWNNCKFIKQFFVLQWFKPEGILFQYVTVIFA